MRFQSASLLKKVLFPFCFFSKNIQSKNVSFILHLVFVQIKLGGKVTFLIDRFCRNSRMISLSLANSNCPFGLFMSEQIFASLKFAAIPEILQFPISGKN